MRQVIDPNAASATASIAAEYEYDPYGDPLHNLADPNASGPYALTNPIRFSTKYFDNETGLGYWGYRYYNPKLGRWVSRDPIGEVGGANLFLALANNPISALDPRGESACPKDPADEPNQPAMPEPPVKPEYKTCDKVHGEGTCAKFCKDGTPPCPNSDNKEEKKWWGIACCPQEGRGSTSNKPKCTCVCPDKPAGKYPDGAGPITECVLQHEEAHTAKCGSLPVGSKNECQAYTKTAKCVGGSVGSCGSGASSCKCLKELYKFLTDEVASGCRTNCGGQAGKEYDCDAEGRKALDAVYRASLKAGCTGNDGVPPP